MKSRLKINSEYSHLVLNVKSFPQEHSFYFFQKPRKSKVFHSFHRVFHNLVCKRWSILYIFVEYLKKLKLYFSKVVLYGQRG